MLQSIKSFAATVRRELAVWRMVLHDPRTPWTARLVLGLAVGYLLLPFDLLPDWIPVIGQLDDLILVPLLVWLALKLIPKEVVDTCRSKVSKGEG